MGIQLICAIALTFNTLNMNLERLLHYIQNVHASHESENQGLVPSPNTNREDVLVLRSRIPPDSYWSNRPSLQELMPELFHQEQSRQRMKITTLLHVVLKLRMCEIYFYPFMHMHNVVLRCMKNFTFMTGDHF